MTRILVVGAGPAGSAAALAARRAGAEVLLVDRAVFPRDKACGDGVAPQVLDVLSVLGLDPAAVVAGSAPVRTLRLESPGGAVARRATQRSGWVVPRRILDDRLRTAALDAGAQPWHHTVREVTVGANQVVVDGVAVDVLIAADGAESRLRRQVVPGRIRAGTVALAIRGYAPADAWPSGEQLLRMTRANWPAYAWMFPIGDGRANVGYGELLRSVPPTRAHLLRTLHALLPGVDPAQLRAHRLPLSTGRISSPDGRVLLAGDAAGLINPMTGEGIYYAVLSGALAGAAAAGTGRGRGRDTQDPGRAHRRALHRALGWHLHHTDALARLSRRPVLLDAGIAAARDHVGVFDEVVELGLGAGRVGPRTALRVLAAAVSR